MFLNQILYEKYPRPCAVLALHKMSMNAELIRYFL